MMTSFVKVSLIVLGFLLSASLGSQESTGQKRPAEDICKNQDLLQAMKIIDRACVDLTCDFESLRQLNSRVDRPTLFAALRSPYLSPVHIFYPASVSRVESSFDWRKIQEDLAAQRYSVADPKRAVIFVLGHASTTGSFDLNVKLSRDRMRGVLDFLKASGINCHRFKGAWFGNDILQLDKRDAERLDIEPWRYREDELILNQAVHVFIYPCGEQLDSF